MRTLSLLALLLTVPAFAQPGAARTTAQITSPFIDEHTLVVVRIDVARVDVDTVLKLATTVIGEGDGANETIADVRLWVKEFTKRTKDLYLTYGPGDFPNTPCLFAEGPKDEAGQLELARILSIPFKKTGVDVDWSYLHGCVCVGTKDALAVLKARKPVERPDLVAALQVGSEGVAQLAFAMSAEAKKIHEQVSPTLPAELGGGSIHKITRGMKWVSLTVGAGPKMPAKLITEATSPQAAHDLKGLDIKAQQLALGQLLKGETETDAAFDKRIKELLARHSTTVEGSRITTEWELATTLLEAIKLPDGPPADRVRSANNLKLLVLALHNFHDAHGRFPTDVRDKDGKPLLSWRVQILPYIEQDKLYKQFKLDEPWDSDNNKKLIAQMPKTLRSPRQGDTTKDKTTYLAPLGKGFIWDDPKGIKIFEIADGTSNTIVLVEADDERSVIWSKPEDITIDVKNPFNGLLGHYTDGIHIAMADGSVRFMKKNVDPKTLWAMFTRDGGEVIDFSK
jgi:hypothetical protein